MKRPRFAAVLFALLLVVHPGCGTVVALASGTHRTAYGGVRLDVYTIRSWRGAYKILPFVDLPLSFALDTALLPITALFSLQAWSRGGRDISDEAGD